MRKKSPFTQSYEQLPNTLPIFPLSGAVVLPGGTLTLNIFEPRYLNMVQDAMKADQLIGMIQPQGDLAPSPLHNVGCAGRVVHYSETVDGRLEILLEGLCRFSVREELSCVRGYRIVQANWQAYEKDFLEQANADKQISLLFNNALRRYFSNNDIDVDWAVIESLSQEILVSNLVSQLALSPTDKQLLVEAHNLEDRVRCFTTILVDHENEAATRH